MIDPERIMRESEPLLAGGNIVLAVRHCVDLINRGSRLEKRAFTGFLRGVLLRYAESLWPEERENIRDLLTQLRLPRDLAAEKRALAAAIKGPPSQGEKQEGVGEAMVLLAGVGQVWGQTFGVTQPLAVMVRPWGGQIRLSYAAQGEILTEAFRQGVLAALDWLFRSGLGGLDQAIFLNSHSFEGTFPFMTAAVDGPSLGLAAAMAALSGVLAVPVPRRAAFTGAIDFRGNVLPVGGIREKVEAARDKGIEQIFVPAHNHRDVPREFSAYARPVNALAEVASAVFPTDAVQRGIERIRETRVPDQMRERHWLEPGEEDGYAERWLFTCVGHRDPFGPLQPRADMPVPAGGGALEDGPVLAACRALRPRKLFLFYTVTKPGNDFSDNAKRLIDLVRRDDPHCLPIPVPLDGLSDPTDYLQLVPLFQTQVQRLLSADHSREGRPCRASLYVNLSPGTAQMETTWQLLVERGVLPARRIQVRESRWLREGESRVRLADPPPLVR